MKKEKENIFHEENSLSVDEGNSSLTSKAKLRNPNTRIKIIAMVATVSVLGGWMVVGNFPYYVVRKDSEFYKEYQADKTAKEDFAYATKVVIPEAGADLSVSWDGLGKRLMETGVIDRAKMEKLYEKRGGLSEKESKILFGDKNIVLSINSKNANVLLNALWALGLANKNEILEKGEMSDPKYKGAGNFASTGGWSLSDGKSMDHYSKHELISLTAEQQAMVENVSKGIYRPCCGNSTHFPDCNHGMAMLGLLQLMASQGFSQDQMYDAALKVNSYWFPETYINLARYYAGRDIPWDKVDSKEILGAEYSSGSGYNRILQEIAPIKQQQGASCGV